MKFELNFNIEKGKEDILTQLSTSYDEGYFFVELADFDAMKEFENKVFQLTGEYYSLIVGFDAPTIFLDKSI